MPKISKSHTTPHFEKQFGKIPKDVQRAAVKKILIFEQNPLHPGLETHKLKGGLSSFWAFSINKKYRVLFRFLEDGEVVYYDIDTHNIYKK